VATDDRTYSHREGCRQGDLLASKVDALQNLSVKLSTLVEVLQDDVEKLETRGVDKTQLSALSKRVDALHRRVSEHMDAAGTAFRDVHEHAEACATQAEKRVVTLLDQRIQDLKLDKQDALLIKVERHDEFISTFKQVAIKNGLFGGGLILVIGSALIYIARGIFTGDWSPFV